MILLDIRTFSSSHNNHSLCCARIQYLCISRYSSYSRHLVVFDNLPSLSNSYVLLVPTHHPSIVLHDSCTYSVTGRDEYNLYYGKAAINSVSLNYDLIIKAMNSR